MIPFTFASKIINLGISVPKEGKDLYTENCRTLVKEIKEDINKEKIFHTQGLKEYC